MTRYHNTSQQRHEKGGKQVIEAKLQRTAFSDLKKKFKPEDAFLSKKNKVFRIYIYPQLAMRCDAMR